MKKILQILILTGIIGFLILNDISAQTMMNIPAPSSSYSGTTRGYWFQAPCNFNIVGLRVPTNFSTANSWMTVVDFGTTQPPVFSVTTNSFTTLAFLQNIAGTTMVTVNIPITSGHYIGIMGCRASPGLSNYTAVTTSYATSINGLSTTLYRLGMQFDLSTSTGPHDLWYEVAGTIAVMEMYYSVASYAVDAGISAINTPTSPMIPGTTNVTGTIKNFGNDTLRSSALRWSVNGSLQTSPSNWTGTLAKNATNGPITFGSYNFTPGLYTIKAWTTNPNNVTDSNKNNDTATTQLISCNPANGTYVIDKNGTGDFLKFSDAISWLSNCGITGPVTFRVKSGTYNEQVTIPSITGASATNTITFESYNLDSTSVNLTYSATGTADNWVLRFNGCSYVTFRKMTVTATGTSYGRVVEFINAASYDNLESNILQTLITTSSNYAVVYAYNTVEQYNTIKNNVIIGGYYGIYWYGVSTAYELGNVIEGNIIRDFYYYGIYLYYQDAIKIRKNTLINSTASGSVYGIYSYYCRNNIEYTQNNIQLAATATMYGLYMSTNAGTAALRGIVSNNFISTGGTSVGTIYALYLTGTSYQDINFNSISISNTVTTYTTSRALYITSGTASTVNVLNNNIANLGNGYAIYTGTATTALGTCNYNNLYATTTALCYWTSNNISLSAWRTASGKDANSVSTFPGYFSTTDLHVNTTGLNGVGTPVTGYTVDIDGDTRQNPPDIGADEFNLIANDAGVTAMAAPIPPCPGINSVSVKVKNFGTAPMTSVTMGWSVNGVIQSPLTTTISSLNQYQEAVLNLGNYSFSIGTSYDLKFWASQPNGVTDGNARNDTFLFKNLTTSFGGTYTIGGATADYPTITAAIAAVQAKGICTPTTFMINKGTYTGRIVIPVIPGTSAVNRITFNGRYADSVKITYAGTSTALATVLFNGADYITFKNVTIENTAAATAYGICFINQADYNTIDSCKILVDQTGTVATVAGVVSTSTETSVTGLGNNANYTTITNCLIKGGYYGIKFNGTSNTVKCINNSVINCTFDKVYYYGIYFYYQKNGTMLNNYLAGFRYTSASGIYNYYYNVNSQIIGNTILNVYYGIYNYYYDTNSQIIGNTIRASYAGIYSYYGNSTNIERNDIIGGYQGIYFYQETNPVDSSTIINNLIHQGGNISYPQGYGLYLYYAAKTVVLHNTIQTDSIYSSTTSTYGAIRIYYSTNLKIKNNIFKSYGNLPCLSSDGNGIAAGDLDYNIYYTVTNGNTIAYWGSTTYTSFNVWKSAMPTLNINSLNIDPLLVSKYNLHLKTGTIFNRGIALGIDKDVDNDYRCLPIPTIGADEFIHPYSKPDADFLADTFACMSSPYTFLNKAGLNEAKRHFWYVNNVFKSNAINFNYNFQTPGVNTVTLITQNCSTTDTVTKTLSIGYATKAPVSYFVVNKNKVEVNEQITLTDISSSCPEHWKWTISPDSFFDPTVGHNVCTYLMAKGADTTQSPQIAFIYSGIYSVCLSTSNSINIGTIYCLNRYIEVLPAVKLCYSPFETKEFSGTIYDDGGNAGQYGANKNCALLIHPCTKSVSLVFNTFDIVPGDYIRIYDGKDNLSTPLWNPVLYPDGLNNNNLPPSSADTFIAKSGSMYIEISTDGATQGNGIVAKWFSTPDIYTPTVASFDISDTICNGTPIVFSNTSTGTQNDYFWDFENDGVTDASTFNGIYKYMQDGDYYVKLIVKGCGGTDSLIRKVYVNTILAAPVFELLSSNIKPNAYYELVTLTQNTLQNCVDTTIWDITPKSYTLVSGKLDNSASITLKFDDTVCYNFTLIGKYHGFSDTMYYPCFIKPISYCKPMVVNTSPDIGISRVRLNTIDNYSDIGVTGYYDYSNIRSTDLERGASYNITIDRNSISNPMSRKVWIDYNRDGYFDNNTELVASENSAFTLSWTETINLSANLDLGITRMRIGTSLGTSPNSPCGPNIYGEFEDYRLNIIRDRTKPIMSLIGPQEVHIQECTAGFIDPGVAVTDNADSNVADSVKITGSVNTRKSGSYIITYNVKDASGNVADPLTRTVIVDKEPIPPQISLLGNPSEVIQIFTSYKDSGYVAFDTCSGLDTVIATNGIDTANIGTYSYSYRAYDKNGNYADISRIIYVMDTIDPVITSISDDTINLNIYNILPNPLYSVTDNYYSYYNIKVTIEGNYYQNFPNGEATIPGFYTFMYVATDGSGNSDSISFVIHVVDKVKPELQLLGDPYFYICRFETITDPGYTVTDNYDPNPTVVKSGSYMTDYLANKKNGNYELLYTATDNSGNRSVASRFIFVTDTGICFNSVNPSDMSDQVRLYPNPGNGKFNLIFNIPTEQRIKIEVYNSIGMVISKTEEIMRPGQVKSFNYQDMKPGMYFIQLVQGEKITTMKYTLMKY